jgi:23S rRNA (uracil1939-C5)-methyltransferase
MEVDIEDCSLHRHALATSICPIYRECGGCDLMGYSDDEQRLLRVGHLERKLGKLLDTQDSKVDIQYSNTRKQLKYRYRAKFHVQAVDDVVQLKVGFMQHNKRVVVDVKACAVLSEELAEAYRQVYSFLGKYKPKSITGMEILVVPGGGEKNALMTLNPRSRVPDDWPQIGKLMLDECSSLRGVGIAVNKRSVDVRFVGEQFLVGRTPEQYHEVAAALGGFMQGNLYGAETLIMHVMRLCGSSTKVLELHGGSGLLSHALASTGMTVRSIEIIDNAVQAAQLLTKLPHGRLTIETGNAHTGALRAAMQDVEVTLVDPPRSGLGVFCQHIRDCGSAKVIGVFCSIDACVRDLIVLSEAYTIDEIIAVNLFPQTQYVETVVLLSRKEERPAMDPAAADLLRVKQKAQRRSKRKAERRAMHEEKKQIKMERKRHQELQATSAKSMQE